MINARLKLLPKYLKLHKYLHPDRTVIIMKARRKGMTAMNAGIVMQFVRLRYLRSQLRITK